MALARAVWSNKEIQGISMPLANHQKCKCGSAAQPPVMKARGTLGCRLLPRRLSGACTGPDQAAYSRSMG